MIEHRLSPEFRIAGRTLSGRALAYGDVADMGAFRERFVPGAFGEVGRIEINLQHDRALVIARDALLTDSPRELRVRADLPEGSAALALVKRGALNGFSIEFNPRSERREAGVRIVERADLVGLALVDRGAYPESTAEVRARRGRTLRQRIPSDRSIGCQCSGVTCKFAEITSVAMQEMIDSAMSEVTAEILAVRGSYGTPLASKSAGSVRMRMRGKDAEVEVDLPDGPDGDAILRDLDNVPGAVLVRPYLDADASEGTVQAMRAEGAGNVMLYTRAVLRSLVVSATDAVEGWPKPELIPTPGMDSERAAPEQRRRIWL